MMAQASPVQKCRHQIVRFQSMRNHLSCRGKEVIPVSTVIVVLVVGNVLGRILTNMVSEKMKLNSHKRIAKDK